LQVGLAQRNPILIHLFLYLRAGAIQAVIRNPSKTKEKNMKKSVAAKTQNLNIKKRPLATPTDLKAAATRDIAGAMNAILADVYALYLKTKNFHLSPAANA
jgi:hypothetical protein